MLSLALALALTSEMEPRQIHMQERIDFIQAGFDKAEKPTKIWFAIWLSGYSAAALGQGLGAIFVNDSQLRANFIVGGTSALIAALAMVIAPPPSAWAGKKLRSAPNDDLEAKLSLGEKLLRDASAAEIFQRGWLSHVMCAAVSVASWLVLWLAFKLPVDGALAGIASMHIALAQVYSRPIYGMITAKDYERRFGGPASGPASAPGTLPAASSIPTAMHFTFFPGGLGFAGGF